MICVFFNDTATTEIYTLSLHDALPIWACKAPRPPCRPTRRSSAGWMRSPNGSNGSPRTLRMKSPMLKLGSRSEEHTSELQSRQYLVCRLLLEKKKHTATQLTLYNFKSS